MSDDNQEHLVRSSVLTTVLVGTAAYFLPDTFKNTNLYGSVIALISSVSIYAQNWFWSSLPTLKRTCRIYILQKKIKGVID